MCVSQLLTFIIKTTNANPLSSLLNLNNSPYFLTGGFSHCFYSHLGNLCMFLQIPTGKLSRRACIYECSSFAHIQIHGGLIFTVA